MKTGAVPRFESQTELFETDSPRRLGLVLNPEALRYTTNPEAARTILEGFKDLGETALIDKKYDLGPTLRRWRAEGLDLLVISGGDGTMQLVVGELVAAWEGESLPRLLLIHGGTGGIVPTSTGNPDPHRAVASLRAARCEQRPLQAQALRTLRVGERITFSCGIGVFKRLISRFAVYWGSADWSRFIFAARVTGSILTQGEMARHAFLPCPVPLRIGDEFFPAGHFVGLYASSLDRIWNLRAFERIPRPHGGFRVIGLRAINRRSLVRSIYPSIKGYPDRLPEEFLLRGTRSLELLAEDEPIDYEAEGEFYTEQGPLSIKPGPELTVIRLAEV